MSIGITVRIVCTYKDNKEGDLLVVFCILIKR